MSARAAPAAETGEIADLNHDGEGVIRAGKTAFVAGALPGEQVRYQRRRRHSQYDEAELLEILQPSPLRIKPPCPHFGLCGGCALQHLAPESQLAIKQQQLQETLLRIGKVEPQQWFAPLAGPVWHYRRRARLGARYVNKMGRSLVGFRERWGSYIAAIDSCEVLARPVNALITPLSQLLTSLSIRERIPQIEVAVADDVTALVLRVLTPPAESDLQQLRQFEQVHGVRIYLQSGGLDTVTPLQGSAPELSYALPEFGLQLQFLPSDFIQINAAVNRQLVARAVELLQLDSQSKVLDLFCGLGNFTLALARRAAAVVGIEGEASLVARARANAQRNGVDNVQFHVANLFEQQSDAGWADAGFNHVLLDPPRAGALELLPLLARLAPRRIVYVSCHPGTLARDLGLLVHEHGYRLSGAGVADMFPHTAHVESIAVLERDLGENRRS